MCCSYLRLAFPLTSLEPCRSQMIRLYHVHLDEVRLQVSSNLASRHLASFARLTASYRQDPGPRTRLVLLLDSCVFLYSPDSSRDLVGFQILIVANHGKSRRIVIFVVCRSGF